MKPFAIFLILFVSACTSKDSSVLLNQKAMAESDLSIAKAAVNMDSISGKSDQGHMISAKLIEFRIDSIADQLSLLHGDITKEKAERRISDRADMLVEYKKMFDK